MTEANDDHEHSLSPEASKARRPLTSAANTEARLRLALDAGRMAIWSVDAGGNVEVSPEFNRLLKLPEDTQPSLEELLSRYYPGEFERVQVIIAKALEAGSSNVEWEYRHLWPNDEVRWLLVRAEFFKDEQGAPAGSIGVIMDITERKEAEAARARAEAQAKTIEQRYRRVFEQTKDPIITADLNQVITDANPAAAEAVGVSREEAIGRGIADFIPPEDYEQSSAKLDEKIERGGTTRYDVRVRGAGGATLFWEINSGLTYDEEGKPLGLHVVARDVTERKRWERHQALLVAELNHRVKNTLAIVQSLAHQTFKRSENPSDAIAAYEGRLNALAAAHNLLTRENWESAEIAQVVEGSLQPFCTESRCSLHGPPCRVGPRVAVRLSLALHELATNAVKYGAFSNEDGKVSVAWTSTPDGLEITWRESGGPEVTAPAHKGFGTRMLQRALAQDVGGNVALAFEPEGVSCKIIITEGLADSLAP